MAYTQGFTVMFFVTLYSPIILFLALDTFVYSYGKGSRSNILVILIYERHFVPSRAVSMMSQGITRPSLGNTLRHHPSLKR